MYSAGDTPKGWVAPFGHPRIKACSRLPMAFRSVPRPSSPPGAKASTECPSHTPYKRQSSVTKPGNRTTTPSCHCARLTPNANSASLTNAPDHCHRTERDDPNTLTRNSASLPVRQSPDTATDHSTRPQASVCRPEPTESSYAPRGAPEPDSQHKRTAVTPPGRAQQHHGSTGPPHALGGRPIRRRSRIQPMKITHSARRRHHTRRTPEPLTLVETIGFEPMTPCLQSRCSTN